MKTSSRNDGLNAYIYSKMLAESSIAEKENLKEKEKRILEDARYQAYLNDNRGINNAKKYSAKRTEIKTEFLEAALDTIFDKCFGNTNFDNTDEDNAFNQSIINNYVCNEGVDELLDRFKYKTKFLSELSLIVKEAGEEASQDLDIDSAETYVVDPTLKADLIDNIKGDETVDDITDTIRFKVSRATEDFVQKNVVDKIDIKDIMYNTKEKLDSVKTGDDTLDEEIKQEQTIAAKKSIRKISQRPHSIYEQMVINMTEAILCNDELKESFTLESGKLDMDKIIKRSTSCYTFLEMVNTLKLNKVDDKYIQEALNIK